MRAVLLAVVAVAVTSCGTGSGTTAVDPPVTPAPSPTVGSYPSYQPTDYRFTLRISCFCAGAGSPIRVTVTDGEVSAAVYAENGRGVRKGDPVEDYRWVSINDVIDAANDTGAASVRVKWPAGQDHPRSVYVDQDERAVDEEIGYAVSDVVVD